MRPSGRGMPGNPSPPPRDCVGGRLKHARQLPAPRVAQDRDFVEVDAELDHPTILHATEVRSYRANKSAAIFTTDRPRRGPFFREGTRFFRIMILHFQASGIPKLNVPRLRTLVLR